MTTLEAMKLAIQEAKKGIGYVSPNPPVGCVILDSNEQLLATGFHAKVGGPHAEIAALDTVKDLSKLAGAHMIVTLEPCAHHGRTPPCAERIASLPLAKLTYGMQDPNPLVNGQGMKIIKAAGIEVAEYQELRLELAELAEVFLWNIHHKETFFALKVATSLDGALGLKTGESRWISGEKSREYTHLLRGQYDAVLVGVQTVLQDNPRLNCRNPQFAEKPENKVIILDPSGLLLDKIRDLELLKVRRSDQILVITTLEKSKAFLELGFEAMALSVQKLGQFDLQALSNELLKRKITSVLVEGGAQTYSAFIKQKIPARLYQFIAPKVLGAEQSRVWTEAFAVTQMEKAVKLHNPKWQVIGDDVLLTGTFAFD